jgi:tetratricopeptide (TPR) repeat protein
MKPTHDLYDLVHSLTKSEKRFFKLQSSLQAGEKNYVRLFDLLEKMDQYDEEFVKETFKGELFLKHLPSEKNHLFKLILKSLRSYHAENSVRSILKQSLKNVDILHKKGLFEECKKELKRAKKTAVSYEFFYYLFEIISWQKNILEEDYENGEFTQSIEEIADEEALVLSKLQNLAQYQVLYGKVNAIFRSGGFAPSKLHEKMLQEITSSKLLKDSSLATSIRSNCIRLYSLGFCAIAESDIEKAAQYFEEVIQLFEENEWLRDDKAKRYLRSLGQLLTCKVLLNDRVGATEIYKKLEGLEESEKFHDPDLVAFRFRILKQIQVEMALMFDQKIQSDELFVSIQQTKNVLSKEFEMMMHYRLALYEFSSGFHQRALKHVNQIINNSDKELRQDIYGHVRVLNILIHLCLGNVDLVEYALKSTIRFYTQRERNHEADIHFLKVLRSYNKLSSFDRSEYLKEGKLISEFPIVKSMEDRFLELVIKKGMI